MNRRLHNATFAAAVSGAMLVFGLMAATPLVPPSIAAAPSAPAPAAVSDQRAADGDARARQQVAELEARLEAKARAFEARMERTAGSASVGNTVASAMAFAAEVTTEVALVSALGALEAGSGTSDAAAARADAERDERRRHAQRVRGVLAVPYFSFAPALRGAGS